MTHYSVFHFWFNCPRQPQTAIHRHYFILHATCILYFNFYHSRSGHIVFLPRVVFLSLLIMSKTRRCTGCKTLLSEHTFGKPGKSCSGLEQFADVSVVEEDTAFPWQPIEDEPPETIEATLASLLGVGGGGSNHFPWLKGGAG